MHHTTNLTFHHNYQKHSNNHTYTQTNTHKKKTLKHTHSILKDLKGNDAQFIAAAERLRRLTIDDGTTDWSGYLQNTMSKKELIPLITQVGNSKQVCATKRVAMEAIGNLAMLSRASFDQLVKSNAVVKVAEHLTCHEVWRGVVRVW